MTALISNIPKNEEGAWWSTLKAKLCNGVPKTRDKGGRKAIHQCMLTLRW